MSILIWNVGLNKKERRQDLKEHLAKYTPSILVLVETKVKPNKEHIILRCIPPYWFFTNNYEYSFLGRVWVCWNPKVWTGQVQSKGLQQITITFSNNGGFTMLLTAVYGSNWQSRRMELWKELINVHQQHGSIPWAVAGDFNIVRFSDEKVGERALSYRNLQDFNECLDTC